MYICPVCGFDRLEDPPQDFSICPCCGTEFQYDDVRVTRAELRTQWLRGGALWWSPADQPPESWDPYVQLNALMAAPATSLLSAVLGSITSTNEISVQAGVMFVASGLAALNPVPTQSRLPIPETIKHEPKQVMTEQQSSSHQAVGFGSKGLFAGLAA